MKKHILIGLAAVGIWMFASTQAMAVHKGAGDLTCGNCHTIHNSQGGVEFTGTVADGSLLLLRGNVSTRADIHNFCLQCHASDGSRATTLLGPHNNTAPKVLLAGATTGGTFWNMDTTFNKIGAGGDFSFACSSAGGVYTCTDNGVALGKGHSIGSTSATPPGNADGAIEDFTCVTCHDPHGTASDSSTDINRFRNLRKVPRHSGTDSVALATDGSFGSWVGGINGTNFVPVKQSTGALSTAGTVMNDAIWPVINHAPVGDIVGDLGASNWYGSGLIAGDGADGTGGMSMWCASCHDKWHEAKTAGSGNINGLDFNRHPVDWPVEYLAFGASTDYPVPLSTNTQPNSGYQGGMSGDGVYILDAVNYNAAIPGQSLPVSNNRDHAGPYALGGAAGAAASESVYYLSIGAPQSGDQKNGAVMCLTCHFAHGGPYNDNLRWDYTSAVSAGAETGNGVPSTRGCQLCHNRGA